MGTSGGNIWRKKRRKETRVRTGTSGGRRGTRKPDPVERSLVDQKPPSCSKRSCGSSDQELKLQLGPAPTYREMMKKMKKMQRRRRMVQQQRGSGHRCSLSLSSSLFISWSDFTSDDWFINEQNGDCPEACHGKGIYSSSWSEYEYQTRLILLLLSLLYYYNNSLWWRSHARISHVIWSHMSDAM